MQPARRQAAHSSTQTTTTAKGTTVSNATASPLCCSCSFHYLTLPEKFINDFIIYQSCNKQSAMNVPSTVASQRPSALHPRPHTHTPHTLVKSGSSVASARQPHLMNQLHKLQVKYCGMICCRAAALPSCWAAELPLFNRTPWIHCRRWMYCCTLYVFIRLTCCTHDLVASATAMASIRLPIQRIIDYCFAFSRHYICLYVCKLYTEVLFKQWCTIMWNHWVRR